MTASIAIFISASIIIIFSILTRLTIKDIQILVPIVILIFVTAISVQHFIFYYRKLHKMHPKYVRIVYGKKGSFGMFVQACVGFLLIVLFLRVGLPFFLTSAIWLMEKVFPGIFSGLVPYFSKSPEVALIENYLSEVNSIRLADFKNFILFLEESITIHFPESMINAVSRSYNEVLKVLFQSVFWAFIVSSVTLLLLPLILYYWLSSEGKTVWKRIKNLREVLKIILVSFIGGLIFQWVLCWLFMFPLPRLETASLASLAIFTVYVALLIRD